MLCHKASMTRGGHILDNIIIFADTKEDALNMLLEKYPKETGYKCHSIDGSADIENGVADI